ncbi:MAG TPA: lamin tail domain-containing protein, partial [Thermoflexia bacterium]|nr:lamin tail domain-containing protein [Thermoflexia bacterium]
MRYHTIPLVGLLLLGLMAGCIRPTPTIEGPTPTSTPVARTPLVISEVMAGATGNNNYEFIELYNATEEPFDLEGYRLTYRLSPDAEEVLIYAWDEPSAIPPHGHFLLVRAGIDVGAVPDGEFDQPLNTRFGGLTLWDPAGGVADRIGWGDKPELAEGEPAPALENDKSLERRPGGEAGNGQDTDD